MVQYFLNTFQKYCSDASEYYQLIERDRYENNYHRMMKELQKCKENPAVMDLYRNNIAAATQLVEDIRIVHHTDWEALQGIYSEGRLLSENGLAITSFEYNTRLPSGGNIYKMMDYVICAPSPGSFMNGLYELQFSRELEEGCPGFFLPQSHVCYEKFEVDDNIIEMKHWREYLSEFIAVHAGEDLHAFWNEMPLSRRPNFLFPDEINVSFIEQINCVSRGAYENIERYGAVLFFKYKNMPLITYRKDVE